MSARIAAPRLAREQRVDEILVSARTVFCEKGYDAAAVAEIASRIGVVEGTVYKYFSTKRELLLRTLENWYDELFGDYTRELIHVSGARARLHLLIWRHLRSIRDYPQLCRLMFREVQSEPQYRGTVLHELNRRYTQLLIAVIEQGAAAGEFRSDIAPTLLRAMVYGGIEHHSWNYVCGRGELDIDSIADQLVAVICDGMVQPAECRQARARIEPRVVADTYTGTYTETDTRKQTA
ncbi:MAG: TetR/AcrR family transcriptional regulator [Hydrocarboniphaga sp.]|uniref:TetR/AcrR family transcriptional regulator n=1 Tax=Hydrocarboniphaga sp. TaxID=2033016 RepID=UPI00260211C1|nr:TetR/AcrR family transcriptional regulator [Hydrocarboniphaga sp.]MDB5972588.1 TetR/AcrR family transcriptional regulator [Hydrocarboniphaga sp.]